MLMLMAVVPSFAVREIPEDVKPINILATILLYCCGVFVFGVGVFGVMWFVDGGVWQISWIFICAIGATAMFMAVLYCRLREESDPDYFFENVDVDRLPIEQGRLVSDFLEHNPTATCFFRTPRGLELCEHRCLVLQCEGKHFTVDL